ncbi:hypothetical protein [Succinatimonas hippei]|uniref:hypothetical protein n=1 Tax=Succinatimonas hippei TaxID=626938 RepID=UPI002490FF9B|nr:hypothetical protein [Succinatimonas hippei]
MSSSVIIQANNNLFYGDLALEQLHLSREFKAVRRYQDELINTIKVVRAPDSLQDILELEKLFVSHQRDLLLEKNPNLQKEEIKDEIGSLETGVKRLNAMTRGFNQVKTYKKYAEVIESTYLGKTDKNYLPKDDCRICIKGQITSLNNSKRADLPDGQKLILAERINNLKYFEKYYIAYQHSHMCAYCCFHPESDLSQAYLSIKENKERADLFAAKFDQQVQNHRQAKQRDIRKNHDIEH